MPWSVHNSALLDRLMDQLSEIVGAPEMNTSRNRWLFPWILLSEVTVHIDLDLLFDIKIKKLIL
jgi:hypothetical protein